MTASRLGQSRLVEVVTARAYDSQCCRVEILPTARKHGVSDEDIRHAINNAIAAIITPDQPDFTMLIGPDRAARLRELGVVNSDDRDYVIDAMPARQKYLTMIDADRGEPR